MEFYAHCVLSVKTDNVALEVRNFAARLMQEIDGNTWGLGEFAEHEPDCRLSLECSIPMKRALKAG